jgi:hypothetical protein
MGTLGIDNMALLDAVSRYLGYGDDYDGTTPALSAAQKLHVDGCVKSGLRQFFFPPPINGRVHKWSFLALTTSFSSVAPYDTGTVSSSGTTVTATGASWTSRTIDTDYELVVDGVAYPIVSHTNETVVISFAPSTAFSGDTYTLIKRYHTLPSDFGYLEGELTYNDSILYGPLRITGEGELRALEQTVLQSGRPYLAAVRPKVLATSAEQRWQLVLFPYPDAVYTFRYKYSVNPDMLANTGTEYTYGGVRHAETILESCLAVAETRFDDKQDVHRSLFLERLAASVAQDQALDPDYYGLCTNNEVDDASARFLRVSVNSVFYTG